MSTSTDDVRASVNSIYSQLINKRKEQKALKEQEKLERQQQQEEQENVDDAPKLSKKERAEADMEAWKQVIIGLTGDDLEFSKPKSKKKKYKKWIGEADTNTVVDQKPKKAKKHNYSKEFQPELNMLKNLINDQNKFTADLQKRFMNAAGPATKDAAMPNKTLVELATAVNSGRANSLGLLREVGNLKKTIADMYLKQRKLDADLAGVGTVDTSDIGLMGSSIASSLFGDSAQISQPAQSVPIQTTQPVVTQGIQAPEVPVVQAEAFDPSTWVGPELENDYTRFESIPKEVVVQKDRNTGAMRFAALNTETGEELIGADLPTLDPSTLPVNEKDMTVRGPFDESFKLVYVG